MEKCVETARRVGVFKEFHVLADRPVEGCMCYDACQCDKEAGLFKLHYLKAGMTKLSFDYFIWVDADSLFMRNPSQVLEALGRSPLHVPLEVPLSGIQEDVSWRGVSIFKLRDAFRREGVANRAYLSESAFWIIHHDAIDHVYELALGFWHRARGTGLPVDISHSIGYAMQVLCGNPEAHLLSARPDLWASEGVGRPRSSAERADTWEWRHPLAQRGIAVRPAIIHVGGTLPCASRVRPFGESNSTGSNSHPGKLE
ncbi:MAG TPA: hypothetical protein VG146_14715 [Verrucomicrobiae bacterium]|nr:hypothetical protein [Verrucomicrobiae bacterium]